MEGAQKKPPSRKTQQFERTDAGEIIDEETGSMWNPETGRCVTDRLKDLQLKEISAIVSFAKAWKTFYPDGGYFKE